jgi:hypothetical protein
VDKNWLDSEGIYRKSGTLSQIKELVTRFNNANGKVDLRSFTETLSLDPNVVASLLKQYLRFELVHISDFTAIDY